MRRSAKDPLEGQEVAKEETSLNVVNLESAPTPEAQALGHGVVVEPHVNSPMPAAAGSGGTPSVYKVRTSSRCPPPPPGSLKSPSHRPEAPRIYILKVVYRGVLVIKDEGRRRLKSGQEEKGGGTLSYGSLGLHWCICPSGSLRYENALQSPHAILFPPPP